MTPTEWMMFAGLLITVGGAMLTAAWKLSGELSSIKQAVKENTHALTNGLARDVREHGARLDEIGRQLDAMRGGPR